MTGQQLKKAILALAVQGKLVPQNSTDEPASALLKRIVAEKARLVAEGKIKKEKPLPEITEEEKPFEIPASWEWVRLGTCSTYGQAKNKATDKDKKSKMWSLDLEDIEKETGRIIAKRQAKVKPIRGEKIKFEKGDILYSKLRPYLKKIVVADDEGICTTEIVPFKVFGDIDADYTAYVLRSPHIDYEINSASYGAKMPRVGTNTMLRLLIPIPPLAEQKRIVAKIEELLPLVDAYDEAEQKLSTLDEDFLDKLKKSILQQAVQGKLAKQDKNDEPASELLKRIKAEKERLIAEGKIKKEKALSPVTEEEKPFALPEGWEWVRLGDCVSIRGGKRMPKGTDLTKKPTNHIYIRVTDMQHGTILDNDLHYVPDEVYPSIAQYIIKEEDVYIVIVGSTIGKTGLVPAKFHEMNLTENAARLTPIIIKKEWLYRVLDSELFQQQVLDKTKQVGQPKLAITRLRSAVIPIPPLAEQKRTVARVKTYLDLCDIIRRKFQ